MPRRTSFSEEAGNLAYRSTIFQGLFAAFLFIDESEHCKCEEVDMYREGGMLYASHLKIEYEPKENQY